MTDETNPATETEGQQTVTMAASAKATAVKGDTSYVLLSQRSPAGDEWIALGRFEARDPESAIKNYVEKHNDGDTGVFVAIAAKFWKPVTPAVEVVTTKTVTLKAAS